MPFWRKNVDNPSPQWRGDDQPYDQPEEAQKRFVEELISRLQQIPLDRWEDNPEEKSGRGYYPGAKVITDGGLHIKLRYVDSRMPRLEMIKGRHTNVWAVTVYYLVHAGDHPTISYREKTTYESSSRREVLAIAGAGYCPIKQLFESVQAHLEQRKEAEEKRKEQDSLAQATRERQDQDEAMRTKQRETRDDILRRF